MNRKIDFEHDLKIELHNAFKPYGIKIPISNDLDLMLLDYLTILKKIVPHKKREVLISPILQSKLNAHPKRKEIEHISELLKHGENVNIFQSKKLFQTKFHDHLIYEWNIFHFHLSLIIDKKSGHVKGTDQLLFIYITNEQAVLLDTDVHLDGIFGDTKWIEILHDYFPELIERYIVKGQVEIYPEVTSSQRQSLWDKGYILGMTKVKGKLYHSPGIGRGLSGHSVKVTLLNDKIHQWLHDVTEQFQNNISIICQNFGVKQEEANFKLVSGEVTFEIVEKTTNITILTYPYTFAL